MIPNAISSVTASHIKDLVADGMTSSTGAVNYNFSIPEFQRGFVWKATQVRDLAEFLWFDCRIKVIGDAFL